MGLLDESAMWHGSQVIIAKTLASASNYKEEITKKR